MGPSGRIGYIYIAYIGLFGQDMQVLYKYCIWVELPVQRRLCPIL